MATPGVALHDVLDEESGAQPPSEVRRHTEEMLLPREIVLYEQDETGSEQPPRRQ